MKTERTSNSSRSQSRAGAGQAKGAGRAKAQPSQRPAAKSAARPHATRDTFEVATTPSQLFNGGRMPATKENAARIGLKVV
jgi:hypothetical protein